MSFTGPWREQAACRGSDPELFFPATDSDWGAPAPTTSHTARALCQRCPVRADCLEAALDSDTYGVWGGTTRSQRRALRRSLR